MPFVASLNTAIEQKVESSLIWDAITLMWRHCNWWGSQNCWTIFLGWPPKALVHSGKNNFSRTKATKNLESAQPELFLIIDQFIAKPSNTHVLLSMRHNVRAFDKPFPLNGLRRWRYEYDFPEDIEDSWRQFPNIASDWLAVQLPTNQKIVMLEIMSADNTNPRLI